MDENNQSPQPQAGQGPTAGGTMSAGIGVDAPAANNQNNGLLLAVAVVVVVAVVAAGAFFLLNQDDEEDSADDTASTTQTEEADDNDMDADPVMEQENIVETAIATPELSTLVDAVTAAELATVLSDETASFTVFAPTNNAFADIQETVNTLLEPENQAELQNVLQYHVVDGAVFSSQLEDGQVITTLQGDELVVDIREDGQVYINEARVLTADVEASNGVVHVIDTVLVP